MYPDHISGFILFSFKLILELIPYFDKLLANILQALIWVVVTAAIFRAVLFPERPAPFVGLKVGMDF